MVLQDSLSTFFATHYQLYTEELASVTKMLDKISVFLASFLNTEDRHAKINEGFPYALAEGNEYAIQERYSFSTNAMVLNALFRALTSSGVNKKAIHANEEIIFKHAYVLLNKVKHNLCFSEGKLFHSGTWGDNDALTLLSLSNILDALITLDIESLTVPPKDNSCCSSIQLRDLMREIEAFIKSLCNRDFFATPILGIDAGDLPGKSLLVPLRWDRLHHEVGLSSKKHFKYYEDMLHIQLSFSSIPDERFDPAQLAFALEGLILAGEGSSPSLATVIKVLETLATAQESNAFWRPVEPIRYSDKGMLLLPASIEVSNSLLRSWMLLRKYDFSGKITSLFWKLLGRYTVWLSSQGVEFDWGGLRVYGWEAENIGNKGKIHLWLTSEIFVFLESWHSLIRDIIAEDSLKASGLKVEPAKKGAQISWDDFKKEIEPLPEFPQEFRVSEGMWKKFIEPRRKKQSATHYSFLLYGPPGTGKTRLAKYLATALGYRLVIVTPGDFTAGGEDEIEARIKNIFTCLELQGSTVVLFDEMDQFLLDRDSDRFRRQTSVLQFLTNGLLTKIADLRNSKSCLFIIATNYAERIDPAIKRKGRIDAEFALMPLSWEKRRAICEDLMKNKKPYHPSDISSIVKETALCSYGEIEQYIDQITSSGNGKPARTFSPLSYRRRFMEYQEDHDDTAGSQRGQDYMERFQGLANLDSFPPCLFNEMALAAVINAQTSSQVPDGLGDANLFGLGKLDALTFNKLYSEYIQASIQ